MLLTALPLSAASLHAQLRAQAAPDRSAPLAVERYTRALGVDARTLPPERVQQLVEQDTNSAILGFRRTLSLLAAAASRHPSTADSLDACRMPVVQRDSLSLERMPVFRPRANAEAGDAPVRVRRCGGPRS